MAVAVAGVQCALYIPVGAQL